MDSCYINSRFPFNRHLAVCYVCVYPHLSFVPCSVAGALMKNAAIGSLSMCWFSMTLTHLSVFFCLQCAGQASTSPRLEIWSAQSVRLIVSLTTTGRCTVAVKKTSSVLMETLSPWPVPVSVCLYLS